MYYVIVKNFNRRRTVESSFDNLDEAFEFFKEKVSEQLGVECPIEKEDLRLPCHVGDYDIVVNIYESIF